MKKLKHKHKHLLHSLNPKKRKVVASVHGSKTYSQYAEQPNLKITKTLPNKKKATKIHQLKKRCKSKALSTKTWQKNQVQA